MLVKPLARTGSVLSINVCAATGSGPTALAAFDDALASAGVENFNLIRLSSVIPPGSVVAERRQSTAQSGLGEPVIDLSERGQEDREEWGNRLYAVWAFQSAELLAQEAWAGIAWVQDPSDGRGLFVEHEGPSEAQVREELSATLSAISRTRGLEALPQQSVVIGSKCEDEPVASLVIAPFVSEPW